MHWLLVVFLHKRRATIAVINHPLGWDKKDLLDTFLVFVGVGFSRLLDNSTTPLVLDLGLVDAAFGILMELALNMDKVDGGYVLPSLLLLCALLISWRAYNYNPE
ncbi:hypothetical protein L1049_014752 [Liquidambar formosana]|uniref:Uncharacterized protein n=1 Tax=Liquidambar formosana TaxID=63359 RepID=A0AAP0X5M6_LIQFO